MSSRRTERMSTNEEKEEVIQVRTEDTSSRGSSPPQNRSERLSP